MSGIGTYGLIIHNRKKLEVRSFELMKEEELRMQNSELKMQLARYYLVYHL